MIQDRTIHDFTLPFIFNSLPNPLEMETTAQSGCRLRIFKRIEKRRFRIKSERSVNLFADWLLWKAWILSLILYFFTYI